MIDFELSPAIANSQQMIRMMAEQTMRPISREYDEREHEDPTEWHQMIWTVSNQSPVTFGAGQVEEGRRTVRAQPRGRHYHRRAVVG
jgi:hypothetical protein